jgi:hypothetical protein
MVAAYKQSIAMGENVGNDFRNALQGGASHPFAAFGQKAKDTQTALYQHFELCEKELENTALSKLKQISAHFTTLKERMKAREQARLNFDFATMQHKEACNARDKAMAKGKAEKDSDKRVEYERKLEEATATWNALNAALIADLTFLFDNRQTLTGHIVADVVNFQTALFRELCTRLAQCPTPVIPPQCAWRLTPSAAEQKELADAHAHAAYAAPAPSAAPAPPPPPPSSSSADVPSASPPIDLVVGRTVNARARRARYSAPLPMLCVRLLLRLTCALTACVCSALSVQCRPLLRV